MNRTIFTNAVGYILSKSHRGLHWFIWVENMAFKSYKWFLINWSRWLLTNCSLCSFKWVAEQNRCCAGFNGLLSSVHLYLPQTLFINFNVSLPVSHTSLLPPAWATIEAVAQRSGWMPLRCYIELVWPAHWGGWNKHIINNKTIFSLGFAFFLQCLCKPFYLPCWFILALCYPYLFHGKLNTLFVFIYIYIIIYLLVSIPSPFCCLVQVLCFLSQNLSLRPWTELQWSLQKFLCVFPASPSSDRYTVLPLLYLWTGKITETTVEFLRKCPCLKLPWLERRLKGQDRVSAPGAGKVVLVWSFWLTAGFAGGGTWGTSFLPLFSSECPILLLRRTWNCRTSHQEDIQSQTALLLSYFQFLSSSL